MSEADAHHSALAELGDAQETARILRRVHLTKVQCIIASAISFLFPLIFLAIVISADRWISDQLALVLLDVAILLPTLCIFYALTKLNQYRFKLLNTPMLIIIVSAIISAASRIL